MANKPLSILTEYIGPRTFRAVVIEGREGEKMVLDVVESRSKKWIDNWLADAYGPSAKADWGNFHTDYRRPLC